MIKVYHAPQARSSRIVWLLEELGVPYELKKMKFTPQELQGEEYLKIHPMGKVPSIEEDGKALFESGAIVDYILEKYGNGRLEPKRGTWEWALFRQWLHFGEGTAMPPLSDVFQHSMIRPADKRIPAVVDDAKARFKRVLDAIEKGLDGHDYIVGNEFTAADVQLGYALSGANMLGLITGEFPKTKAYVMRLIGREAFQRMMKK